MFGKKSVLRNFEKFTEKHLYQSLFFNKVAGLRPATLLKKRLWHRYCPVNFAKLLRTPFLIEDLPVFKPINENDYSSSTTPTNFKRMKKDLLLRTL